MLILTGGGHYADAIVEHGLVKRERSGIERVRLLLCIMAWERTVFAPIFASDIYALPLNEMSCQANPRIFIVERAQRESRIEEAE